MKQKKLVLLFPLLVAACAPELRFSNSAAASFQDRGESSAQAQAGFASWDVLRLKNGQTTAYRALDSDGVGGWIGAGNLVLKGAENTNRPLSFHLTAGFPPVPFKRYTWDLAPGSNGSIRED
ncbi:MAG: hypothetical protein J0L75_10665 [Spirochaetes bacterium]|nr:hypothetical protein [Spirochaetota bacterium]